MKLAILSLALLILGCGNKPDIVATKQDVVRWCLDHQGDSKAEHFYCEELHGYKYIFDGVKPNYDKYPSWKLRDFGSIAHVTSDQWEAAQGLYNKHHYLPHAWGCCFGPRDLINETFPPSGDAK